MFFAYALRSLNGQKSRKPRKQQDLTIRRGREIAYSNWRENWIMRKRTPENADTMKADRSAANTPIHSGVTAC